MNHSSISNYKYLIFHKFPRIFFFNSKQIFELMAEREIQKEKNKKSHKKNRKVHELNKKLLKLIIFDGTSKNFLTFF
jgi:hypothetical protein